MRIASILVLLAVMQAACSSGGPLNATAARIDAAGVPKPFVANVEAQWKNAAVAPRATAPCAAAPAASTRSAGSAAQQAFIAGDFDGDGASDVAAPVKRDDGLHLVVGLQHTYDYSVVDVTDKPDASFDRVTVRPRGALYNVPGSDVDYYFGVDTLVVTPCGGSPTAYLWNGAGFEAQPLAQ
ncbi:MAG: hypothetical protein ABI634_16090 [Acidobacteriota bacterium]